MHSAGHMGKKPLIINIYIVLSIIANRPKSLIAPIMLGADLEALKLKALQLEPLIIDTK